jgi:hypothetical protein
MRIPTATKARKSPAVALVVQAHELARLLGHPEVSLSVQKQEFEIARA